MARGRRGNTTGFIFLEKGNHVAVLGWWNGTREVFIERADGSRDVRPFRGLREPLREDPYRTALEAEHRANDARKRLLYRVDHIRADNFQPTPGARARGRPVSGPEHRAWRTFRDIESWHDLAFGLALREAVPNGEVEALLQQTQVPRVLWERFHCIVGRWSRYLYKTGLSPGGARELAVLTRNQQRGTLSPADDARVTELRRMAFGRLAAHELDEADNLDKPDAAVLTRIVIPRCLRDLSGALDQWGADKHKTTLQTFRLWRRKLQRAGHLRAPMERPRPDPQPKRHRARRI